MVDFLTNAFAAIPEAVKSGYGVLLFIVTVGAWFVLGWRVTRNSNLLKKIHSFPSADRMRVFAIETGQPTLAKGLTPEQWIRAKNNSYYFYGFVIFLMFVVVLFLVAGLHYGSGKSPSAKIRVLGPRLVDLRSLGDPLATSPADALKTDALLTAESVSYEHTEEPAKKARVLEQSVTVTLDGRGFQFRWFQFVEIGSGTGRGWLGRVGDAVPFSIAPGDVTPKSTQFKPETSITWDQMLAMLKSAKQMEVTVHTTIGGVSDSRDIPVKKSCTPNLEKAQRDIADVERTKGRAPLYLQILCKQQQAS